MVKLNTILLLLLYILSVFSISHYFVSQTTSTFYLSVGSCFLLALATLIVKYKKHTMRLSLTEILFVGFLLFGMGYGEYMGSLSPEWVISGLSLLLFYMLIARMERNLEWLFVGIVAFGLVEAVYGLGQYMYWFNNNADNFRMSGSFDNPAGFAATLSAVFPFALFLVAKKEAFWRIFGGVTAGLFLLAVALSHSRAGTIAMVVTSGLWLVPIFNLKCLKQWSHSAKVLAGSTIIITILIGLYFLKKESANGRLLIWQCTAKMIADKPLLGHGAGGFQREYMPYQAAYFKNHPDGSFTMLADNVKHPFNEFLKLFVEHGLVGVLFMGVVVYLLIREYHKGRNLEKYYSGLCIIGIALFACFSYPLNYPFIRLMLLFSVAIIMKNEVKVFEIPRQVFFALKPLALITCIGLLTVSCMMLYDEYYWSTIAHRSLAGETKKMIPEYVYLYKTMNRNALFLYNYGAELNFIGESQTSNRILLETARRYNDIDLQLLLADNYQKIRQYKDAEACLLLASNMIPNRFIPLYRLFRLYKETGENKKAKDIAKTIINKQIKIISPEVITIKAEMRKELRIN
jgi:O-antigen ligase